MTNLPSPRPKLTPYLTIIPDRRPVQKTHSNIGHAKNALNGRIGYYSGSPCDMELYEHVDGDWKLLYRIAKGERVAPWQVEALKKQTEKKENNARARKLAAEKEARDAANAAYNVLFPPNVSGTLSTNRSVFVMAYVLGYQSAKEEYEYD